MFTEGNCLGIVILLSILSRNWDSNNYQGHLSTDIISERGEGESDIVAFISIFALLQSCYVVWTLSRRRHNKQTDKFPHCRLEVYSNRCLHTSYRAELISRAGRAGGIHDAAPDTVIRASRTQKHRDYFLNNTHRDYFLNNTHVVYIMSRTDS